jgi:hypothetical protein
LDDGSAAAVRQTLGVAFETGSNANGEFARYADGTQICWNVVRTSVSEGHTVNSSGWYVSDVTPVTFPVSFASVPNIDTTSKRSSPDQAIIFAFCNSPSASGFGIYSARTIASTASGFTQEYVAIGRWF